MALSKAQRPPIDNVNWKLFKDKHTPISVVSSTASTYDLPTFRGRMILRDTQSNAVSDVTPTAVAILADNPDVIVGGSFELTIRNTSAGAGTITVTGGTDVTIVGTATIAYLNSKTFKCIKTSETTVTLYSLGTKVF